MKGNLDTAERIRALVTGPPAYVLRRRRIEDLEASILRAIRTYAAKTGARMSPDSPPAGVRRSLSVLHQLIEAHNAYYPIEASLPIDAATGYLLDFGKPWTPMPPPTLVELIARTG
jgi:hypothetical protein